MIQGMRKRCLNRVPKVTRSAPFPELEQVVRRGKLRGVGAKALRQEETRQVQGVKGSVWFWVLFSTWAPLDCQDICSNIQSFSDSTFSPQGGAGGWHCA